MKFVSLSKGIIKLIFLLPFLISAAFIHLLDMILCLGGEESYLFYFYSKWFEEL